MPRRLELLLIADVHYVREAEHVCPIPARHAALGLELLRRVRLRAARGPRLDAVVLMGDLVDNGDAAGAECDLAALAEETAKLGVTTLVVPGNHDGPTERVLRLFGDAPGVHRVAGYQLITFADAYAPDDRAARLPADLHLLAEAAADRPDEPIVALQHSPIHPSIAGEYPYNLTNAGEVMAAYRQAGVRLSLSAHYHPGLAPQPVDGVWYATCPALCEAPWRFIRVSLDGDAVTVREEPLRLTGVSAPLVDHHMHTHYAYCADDVNPTASLQRAEQFGVDRVYFTEHAGQLYLSPEDYWGGLFRRDAACLRRERAAGRDRMGPYRAEMTELRSPRVGLGLEVELDADGELTLLEEDRDDWDFLLGAVHSLRGVSNEGLTASEAARRFMAETERIVGLGLDVLAHPFRIFRRSGREAPAELYEPVAQLLAAHGVAAEVNYHTNEPDPRFFERCLAHGVRIALGTDSHGLWEVGELSPHLELLRQIVSDEDLPRVLYWNAGTPRSQT
ncbi:MAG: hypothetical protein FJX74_10385 [Armatimonadetes bacterium]|nr:hypothetical protein [Armatimonadota bacterium]